MTHLKTCATGLLAALLFLPSTSAHALLGMGKGKKKQKQDQLSQLTIRKLTPDQNALLDKAVLREKEITKNVRERVPLVETYVQVMKPDVDLLVVPESDWYSLGRVDFGKVIDGDTYTSRGQSRHGIFKNSLGYLTGLGKSLKISFDQGGFVSMLLMDSNNFDKQTYQFGFVRREFLGTVRTSVFDVVPKAHGGKATGRFTGRIWVEEQNGNVVRFNGGFKQNASDTYKTYDHFDSWRTNVQPDMWLPTSIYVEESREVRNHEYVISHKGSVRIWGYLLKVPSRVADQATMEIDNATDASNDSQDVSPLGAQRAWVKQAEDNVLDRFFQAGLLDAPSDFDKILEQIANNILIENNVPVSSPIHCRVLLTEPLESLSVGNTIILSKGLIDTLSTPSVSGDATVANLASVLSFQLAHIILGHRLDTRYAFNDRLLFPDTSAFERIPMHHSDIDNESAAKKAMQLLAGSEFKDKLGAPGLYLLQLQQRVKALNALNEPRLGDGLVKGDKDSTFWMQALIAKAPKLDMKNLNQQAAMPLGAMLTMEPWTDQVVQLHARAEPLLTDRDKMPFEVTPVYLKLTYFKQPAAPAANEPATGAAAPGPAAAPAATDAPAGAAPAAPAGAPGNAPLNGTPTPLNGTPTNGTATPPPAAINTAPVRRGVPTTATAVASMRSETSL